MFICSKCGVEFEESLRYSKRTRRCKPCYATLYSERRHNNFQKVIEYKEKYPCADCGLFYPHYVMDFDHVKGEKQFNISRVRMMKWEAIKDEIDKCELVCANCHRYRTHKRRL